MRHKTIDIHAVDRVAVVWLNRPEVRNAMDEAMVKRPPAWLAPRRATGRRKKSSP